MRNDSRRLRPHRDRGSRDALPGLHNNSGSVLGTIAQAIRQAGKKNLSFAVIHIDIDKFRFVNESFGYEVGDDVLREMGSRIRKSIRSSDTSAPVGGAEFVVVLENIGRGHTVEPIVHKILGSLREPVTVEEQTFRLTASAGIAVFPSDAVDASSLLMCANNATSAAKMAGRNTMMRFDPTGLRRTADRVQVELELRRAVDERQLTLFYQPKLGEVDERVSVEALVRWQHPQRGLVLPGEFVPLAEEIGLVSVLGDWALEEACRTLSKWNKERFGRLMIAVNISPSQLQDPTLCDRFVDVAAKYGIATTDLEIEITESSFMLDPDTVIKNLTKLRRAGFSLSLDDFGTGYSSLSMLRRLPIHSVKIDRSFVANIEHERQDADVVRIIILLAETLGISVVAEGVETAGQVAMLRDAGCRIFQGFYFGHPMAFEDLIGWLQTRSSRAPAQHRPGCPCEAVPGTR